LTVCVGVEVVVGVCVGVLVGVGVGPDMHSPIRGAQNSSTGHCVTMQQIPLTQLPDVQRSGSAQSAPFGS
jgi:hypothetical protein